MIDALEFISDKIGIMYLGSMVEFGGKDEIFNNPKNPRTREFLSKVLY